MLILYEFDFLPRCPDSSCSECGSEENCRSGWIRSCLTSTSQTGEDLKSSYYFKLKYKIFVINFCLTVDLVKLFQFNSEMVGNINFFAGS